MYDTEETWKRQRDCFSLEIQFPLGHSKMNTLNNSFYALMAVFNKNAWFIIVF